MSKKNVAMKKTKDSKLAPPQVVNGGVLVRAVETHKCDVPDCKAHKIKADDGWTCPCGQGGCVAAPAQAEERRGEGGEEGGESGEGAEGAED